ncbi:early nodulin-like protein 12 [Actinidia eriantha]|uniref:early nodulin-like protein 12 n=1 Tax=Actinidia eriantha TaxID=165200 RepID=UPI0025837386|nr:early nodulin-like protein 12 [Actinidia eriantha]
MAGSSVKVLMALVVVSAAIGGEWVVSAQSHHVLGGDPDSWSSGRIFRVGDKIWFTYSDAQDNIVELKSKEEYEACNVSNPIRMVTDGVDLIEEGIRYFASVKPESCKSGVKLHVEVQPQLTQEHNIGPVGSDGNGAVEDGLSSATTYGAPADGPSAAPHLNGLSYLVFVGILVSYYLSVGV